MADDTQRLAALRKRVREYERLVRTFPDALRSVPFENIFGWGKAGEPRTLNQDERRQILAAWGVANAD